jgi:hypothetical protein
VNEDLVNSLKNGAFGTLEWNPEGTKETVLSGEFIGSFTEKTAKVAKRGQKNSVLCIKGTQTLEP